MTVLLPASGYGKRNIDEPVKELMIRKGRPLIEFTFLHLLEPAVSQRVKKIVIITRFEKLSALTLWLQNFSARTSFKIPVEFLIHEPTLDQEWPLTLLASEPHWSEKNLVLLPDTQLMLRDLVQIFDKELDSFYTCWGKVLKDLDEVKSYGVIREISAGVLKITEKPLKADSPLIWGCFGFQKKCGRELLKNLEKSTQEHLEFQTPIPSSCVSLDSFADLSR